MVIVFALLFGFLGGRAQEVGEQYAELSALVRELSGYGPVGGNKLRSTQDGGQYIQWLLEDIRAARESVDIEYYWFQDDDVGEILREELLKKTQEGIKVRILMDNLVTPFAMELFYQKMRKGGVEVLYFHDLERMSFFQTFGRILGMRDHRKIVIIDGRIVYTGGINFCHKTIYDWKDTQIRLEGPVAASFLAAFQAEWVLAGGGESAPPSQPDGEGSLLMQAMVSTQSGHFEQCYVQALESARRYFYIQTPYFCPPEGILQAILSAAKRGVDVRLIFPSKCDWEFMNQLTQDHFDLLLEAGVTVFLYHDVYDHSKSFVSDGALSFVGTVNLDKRSFGINLEDGVLIYDASVAESLTARFRELEAQSERVRPGEYAAKGLRKAYRSFLHALSPLF